MTYSPPRCDAAVRERTSTSRTPGVVHPGRQTSCQRALADTRARPPLTTWLTSTAGRVADLAARALGDEHRAVLAARSRTGRALFRLGRYAEDERTQLLSLPQQCAEHLGAGHTVSVGARHNHAWASYQLGRFETADAEILEVTETYLRRFGPDYPIALAARQLQAPTHAALGRTEEAIALMTDVVTRRARSLGQDHPFTAASRDLLDAFRSGRWEPLRLQH